MRKGLLTDREMDILTLKLDGLCDKEIAEKLAISYSTVRTHIDRARLKLGCSNTLQLLVKYSENLVHA